MSLNGAYDGNNIFAKILRGEAPCVKIFEDDEVLAFMDIFPQSQGHCLVVPKNIEARNLHRFSRRAPWSAIRPRPEADPRRHCSAQPGRRDRHPVQRRSCRSDHFPPPRPRHSTLRQSAPSGPQPGKARRHGGVEIASRKNCGGSGAVKLRRLCPTAVYREPVSHSRLQDWR